jgi:carboxyl-terminal processing protease
LPSGYGYIKFDLFNETVAKQFREALAKFANPPGLIIDVRGNPGGDFHSVLAIANNFFSDRVSFGRVIARSGRGPSLMLRMLGVPSRLEVGGVSNQVYTGPVIVLVNEATGSASEIFAAGMQENHRAGIFGRQTCGCVLGSVAHPLKGGGEIDISEFGIVTANDRKLEGSGVMPDVRVPLTLDDLRHHHDATLGEALAVLNSSSRVARRAEQ